MRPATTSNKKGGRPMPPTPSKACPRPAHRPRVYAGAVRVHLLADQLAYIVTASEESGASRSLIARRLIAEALAARNEKEGCA